MYLSETHVFQNGVLHITNTLSRMIATLNNSVCKFVLFWSNSHPNL